MYKIILSLIFFAISINSVFSFTNYEFQDQINVGNSPSKIFTLDDKGFFVVCLGQDIDYDFTFDEGEELPSLWYVAYNSDNNSYTSELKYSFDDFTNFSPVRFGLDNEGKVLFVPLRKGVISLSLDDFTIIDDAISNISANGLEYVAGHLLISSNDENSNGKLTVVNLANNQVLQTLQIGTNLQETIYYPSSKGISIATLSVGPFGESNSKVFYGAIDHKFDFALTDSVVLGNTGNHLQFSNGKIYATVNMSHIVKEIDPVTNEVRTFHTGTSGYNGPRESMVINNKLYVTTYAEDIRIFDLESGTLESIIDSYNDLHLEGIEQIADGIFATSGIFTKEYSVSKTVEIYKETSFNNPFLSYDVGTAPLWLENLDGVVNVFCNGIDNNSNGKIDNEDEKPSWWIIKNNKAEKIMDLDEFLNVPLRPAIDRTNNLIFMPHYNSIKSYSYSDYNLVDDAVSYINAKALDIAGGHLIIAKGNEVAPDSIFVLNLSNGMMLQKLPAGDEIFDVKYYPDPQGIGLAFVSYFESNDEYRLMYGPINHMVDFELDNEVIVDKPFQLIFEDGNLVTVSRDAGNSTLVDVNTKEYNEYNWATNDQFYGPLSITKVEDYLVSVTLNSDLRIYDLQADELQRIMPIKEGSGIYVKNIGVDELNLAICVSFIDTLYTNKVIMMKETPVSVLDKITYDNVKVFPNPAQDYIKINLLDNNNYLDIKIININGNIVKSLKINTNDRIDIQDLENGSYIINIESNNNYYNLPLKITR